MKCQEIVKHLPPYSRFKSYVFWLPAWWALWLLWWPLTDAAMFQCAYGYSQSVFFFLVLFHCCILLEIKLTTTTTYCLNKDSIFVNGRLIIFVKSQQSAHINYIMINSCRINNHITWDSVNNITLKPNGKWNKSLPCSIILQRTGDIRIALLSHVMIKSNSHLACTGNHLICAWQLRAGQNADVTQGFKHDVPFVQILGVRRGYKDALVQMACSAECIDVSG